MKKNNENSYDLPEGFESVLEMLGSPKCIDLFETNHIAKGALKSLVKMGYGKTQCFNAFKKMGFDNFSRYLVEKKWEELKYEKSN